ncbi:MAG: hypothetical protein NT013_05110 [Planctomycetia bacterium]|nr:hypothetical protein [Planctomycetia bacterium]
MSPANTTNKKSSSTNASIHDVWLRQRAELEEELLEVGNGIHSPDRVATVQEQLPKMSAAVSHEVKFGDSALPISLHQTALSPSPISKRTPGTVELPTSTASLANIQQSLSAATTKQFLDHQQNVDQELTRQREAFAQEVNRQRTNFEQELAARDAVWTTQRDREWAALQAAKEVHAAAVHRLQSDLAMERVREHEELQHWRQQAEAELTVARRLFEQDRMQQQAEFSRQRASELDRLRQERAEFEAQLRQSQIQLVEARGRHEQDLQQASEYHATRMQSERTELEQQREAWTEKFRQEQLVLENGLQFFEQHMARFNADLKSAQHNIQTLSTPQVMPTSAEQFAITIPFSSKSISASTPSFATTASTPLAPRHDSGPVLLSLDEIRERLNQLKSSQQQKVA